MSTSRQPPRRQSSVCAELEAPPTASQVDTRPPMQGMSLKGKQSCKSLLEQPDVSFCELGGSIFGLFLPIFTARLAWIGMKTTDTSLLGHSGTSFLSASALADFWTGAFAPFMTDSVMTSKCGPAYGAGNYDMVAIWTQVSLTLYTWITIPIMVAFSLTGPALQHLMGLSDEIAGYAGYYATVLGLCLPAKLISGKVSAFFYCQAKTKPSFVTTVLALVLNLVFGLQLVLGIPFANGPKYGFWACPLVTTCVEWFITGIFVLVYCKFLRYHDQCWSGEVAQWSYFRDVFLAPICAGEDSQKFAYYIKHIRPHLRDYAKVALPANLASASDFWRMSAIGILAGTLGTKEVAVFNASYRLAWMNLTVIGSFSSSAMVQLGLALGTGDSQKSQRIKDFGVGTVASFLVLTTALTVYFVRPLASIFSSDPEVIELFDECKYPMGGMIFFMAFSMHFEAVLFTLGRSQQVARAAIAGSWLGQVPAVVLMLHVAGHQLKSVYTGVGIGYLFYLILIVVPFLRVNWDAEAQRVFEENQKQEPLNSAEAK